MITVIAKQAFSHDGHRPAQGEAIEVNETLAGELERAVLVDIAGEEVAEIEVKNGIDPLNKKAAEPKNKSL